MITWNFWRARDLRDGMRAAQILRPFLPESPPPSGTRHAWSSCMTITMEQLVVTLFDSYDRRLHDEKLAAVATEVRITELLEQSARARRARMLRRAA